MDDTTTTTSRPTSTPTSTATATIARRVAPVTRRRIPWVITDAGRQALDADPARDLHREPTIPAAAR
jgi:hypothetical protein